MDKTTGFFKNLAFALIFIVGIGGGWNLLTNSFLEVYLQWIMTVGFQVLMFGLALGILVLMLFLAFATLEALMNAAKALFTRKKNDDH